jgi:L-aspartate oxidase
VHGANRLASNSLLEGLVFGARAAEAMQDARRAAALKADRIVAGGSWLAGRLIDETRRRGVQAAELDADSVRDLMWRAVGLFRTHDDLQTAVAALAGAQAQAFAANAEGWRLRNLITVAGLIACAAVRREESRGGHFRADFPKRDDRAWRVHIADQITATDTADPAEFDAGGRPAIGGTRS